MKRAKEPDIVLMDSDLPGMNGIEATRRITTKLPGTQLVFLTVHENPEFRTSAAAAGASAFMSKKKMVTALIPVMKKLLPQPEDIRNNK